MFATSSRNFGSNNENSVWTSEKRLITPSLLILCFKSSLMRSFTSGSVNFFPVPPETKRTVIVLTDSKKAASMRVCSSTKLLHSESACLRSRASLINTFCVFSWSGSSYSATLLPSMKFTPPLMSFALSRSLPVMNFS